MPQEQIYATGEAADNARRAASASRLSYRTFIVMRQKRKFALSALLIATLAFEGTSFSEESKREWKILEAMEEGQPIIVRVLGSMPKKSARSLRPWRLTVEWRYEENLKGLPTEPALQKAREIEDGLYSVMQKTGLVALPLVKTGNGLRSWQYYVEDAEKVEKPILTFLESRPEMKIVVKAAKDESWLTVREVLENAHP
ncbi:hypothetical protein BH11PSE11_BH11PSE11_26020 [soil metagenome]